MQTLHCLRKNVRLADWGYFLSERLWMKLNMNGKMIKMSLPLKRNYKLNWRGPGY